MAKSSRKKKSVDNIPQSKGTSSSGKKKGVTTQERVKQHLNDKNDIITEEDIKDLHLDIDIPADEAHSPLELTNDEERPKDEDKDKKIITPWDVISE
jgi:hypothetical protein